MSNRKADIPFEIIQTADGSLTLSLDGGESMHSLAGAFSETQYIYGSCLEELLAAPPSHPKVFSMGLGLGYNEWLTLSLLYKKNIESFSLVSAESVSFLRDHLIEFLGGGSNALCQTYDDILIRTATHSQLNPDELKKFAKRSLDSGHWVLGGALTPSGSPNQVHPLLEDPMSTGFHGILYDAFSGGTDRSLWTQDHLDQFLKDFATKTPCFFATYAATGNLKRALEAHQFIVTKKPGFAGKRESISARRLSLPY